MINACPKCNKGFPSYALEDINKVGKCCYCQAVLVEVKVSDKPDYYAPSDSAKSYASSKKKKKKKDHGSDED